ncbi:MAG TPA: homoserine O-acetyltransferase, partial [Myxococcota bacterium]|nr:homoserine O-acetyltransferase [Myxococcota bacterium]
LALAMGGSLEGVEIAFETWGELSPARDNAILVCHALSGDSHAARHDDLDDPGWWEVVVGPGKAVDTSRFFVVCANVLGGCRGTTGPNSPHPRTGEIYGPDFPTITVRDMVETQRALLDHLGIDRLHAVIGGSLGGHQALQWAAAYPERAGRIVALATSPRLTEQAIAFDVVGRNAILRDPGYSGGHYAAAGAQPAVGLALARMLGHITYLSVDAMDAKFAATMEPRPDSASAFERKFSVGSYLAHQGERFVERFDANSYMTLSMAMDLFDLGATREALQASFARADSPWLVVSFSSDWLFPPFQSRAVVEALLPLGRDVTYCDVATECGHDAFLLEDDAPIYAELVRGFLAPDADAAPAARVGDATAASTADDTTPSRARGSAASNRARPRPPTPRIDYDHILRLLEPGSSVLDLGCGSGELLARLRAEGHGPLIGVEVSETAIVDCARRGLPVVHADIDQGLDAFADAQFDVVVLSQTLQAVGDVRRALREVARVGRRGIVSFSNVGYAAHRERLGREGRAPQPSDHDPHPWWGSPALRLFSILDFEELCDEMGLGIERRVALDRARGRVVEDDPNRLADLAIFVIRGSRSAQSADFVPFTKNPSAR